MFSARAGRVDLTQDYTPFCREETLGQIVHSRKSVKGDFALQVLTNADWKVSVPYWNKLFDLFVTLPASVLLRAPLQRCVPTTVTNRYGQVIRGLAVTLPQICIQIPGLLHCLYGLGRGSYNTASYSKPDGLENINQATGPLKPPLPEGERAYQKYFLALASDQDVDAALAGNFELGTELLRQLLPSMIRCARPLRKRKKLFVYALKHGIKIFRTDGWGSCSAFYWEGDGPALLTKEHITQFATFRYRARQPIVLEDVAKEA